MALGATSRNVLQNVVLQSLRPVFVGMTLGLAAAAVVSSVSDQPWARPGMDNPRIHWVPSISPSSIMFYTGDKFPNWKNSLFVGALTTRMLLRMSFNQPSQAERREPLLASLTSESATCSKVRTGTSTSRPNKPSAATPPTVPCYESNLPTKEKTSPAESPLRSCWRCGRARFLATQATWKIPRSEAIRILRAAGPQWRSGRFVRAGAFQTGPFH